MWVRVRSQHLHLCDTEEVEKSTTHTGKGKGSASPCGSMAPPCRVLGAHLMLACTIPLKNLASLQGQEYRPTWQTRKQRLRVVEDLHLPWNSSRADGRRLAEDVSLSPAAHKAHRPRAAAQEAGVTEPSPTASQRLIPTAMWRLRQVGWP